MPQSFVGEGSVGAVVIDLGNITTRVGFAGDDIPTAIYPSAMGAYNDAEGRWCCTVEMDGIGWAQPELQVKRLHNAGAGEMADLLFQQLCEHGLQKLRVQPRDTPLLITEAATATAANRCRTTELVFEGLGAPALCVARTPELAAIAAGRVTSVVLEMGAFHSTSSCVVDGAMQPRSVQTSKLATGNLARLLEQQLTSKGTVLEAACCMPGARPPPLGGAAGSCSFVRESQTRPSARPTEGRPPLTPAYSEQLKKLRREVRTTYAYLPALAWTPAPTSRTSRISPHLPASPRISPHLPDLPEQELARELFEAVCSVKEHSVSASPSKQAAAIQQPPAEYTLPDGKVISIGQERFRLPEYLFQGSSPSAGSAQQLYPLHEMVCHTLQLAEPELHKELVPL